MARIVEWATETESAAERRFLKCAQEQLPGHWTVIHGLQIRRGRLDREADFLVLDPKRGALVIEVKGGRIERKDRGRGAEWVSIDRSGERHSIKDPAKQARDVMYAVLREPRVSSAFRNRELPFDMQWAVCFPDLVRPSHGLGMDLPSEIVLFRDDLKDMPSAFDGVFRHYNMTGKSRVSAEDVERFVREIEPPEYRMRRSLAAWIGQDREAIEEVTKQQALILDHLKLQRRAAIEGAAGTGKTVLAAIKAEQLAEHGQRVLLLCYNRALAEWLDRRASRFDAMTFHAFVRERARNAGLPFDPPGPGREQKRFWDVYAPRLLMDALDERPDDRYDGIIVDEGQDFKSEWWPAIECALADERQGILYAFFDPHQNMYDGGPSNTFERSQYPLTRNCRNTRRIASYAAGLIDVSYEVAENAPEGERVASLPYGNPDEMVRGVRKQLHRLVMMERIDANRITVLSTHSTDRSHLEVGQRLGNFTLVDSPANPTDIRFTSIHKFKGLESDVVILVDVDGNPRSCSDRNLYVGATRARTLLIVLEEAKAAA